MPKISKKDLVCWTRKEDKKVVCVSKGSFRDFKQEPKKPVVKKPVVKKPVVKKEVVKKAVVKKAVVKKEVVKKPVVKKAVVKKAVVKKPVVEKPVVKKERKLRNKDEREKIFDTFITFMRSPSKRNMNYLIKQNLDERDINRVSELKKLSDFYPTPTKCLDINSITKSKNILECTAGLGYVVNDIININPNSKITACELDSDLVRIGNNILGDDIIKQQNFLKIPLKNDYDFIFCNPPFSSGYSKKDPFYVKFLIKVLQLKENNNNKNLQIQFLCPITIFSKIGSEWEGGRTLISSEFFKKVSQKQLKTYCESLNYDIKKLLESKYVFTFLKPCQFETTKIQSANFKIS